MPYPNPVFFFVSGLPYSAGARGQAWREKMAEAARSHYKGPAFEGPVEMQIIFWMKRPKSHYQKRKRKPDAPFHHDKIPARTILLRHVEVALTGILWLDASQIVSGETHKRYEMTTGPGVTVSVRGIRR